MPIAFAARMPAMRPDSIAAMRAVAMVVAMWLATPIPVRTHRQTGSVWGPSARHPRGQQVPFDVKFSDYESHVMMYNVLDAGLAG